MKLKNNENVLNLRQGNHTTTLQSRIPLMFAVNHTYIFCRFIPDLVTTKETSIGSLEFQGNS